MEDLFSELSKLVVTKTNLWNTPMLQLGMKWSKISRQDEFKFMMIKSLVFWDIGCGLFCRDFLEGKWFLNIDEKCWWSELLKPGEQFQVQSRVYWLLLLLLLALDLLLLNLDLVLLLALDLEYILQKIRWIRSGRTICFWKTCLTIGCTWNKS